MLARTPKILLWLPMIILLLQVVPNAKAGFDCKGKDFYCINKTQFLICVNFGNSISSTFDDFALACPEGTECLQTNEFVCENPSISPKVQQASDAQNDNLKNKQVVSLTGSSTETTLSILTNVAPETGTLNGETKIEFENIDSINSESKPQDAKKINSSIPSIFPKTKPYVDFKSTTYSIVSDTINPNIFETNNHYLTNKTDNKRETSLVVSKQHDSVNDINNSKNIKITSQLLEDSSSSVNGEERTDISSTTNGVEYVTRTNTQEETITATIPHTAILPKLPLETETTNSAYTDTTASNLFEHQLHELTPTYKVVTEIVQNNKFYKDGYNEETTKSYTEATNDSIMITNINAQDATVFVIASSTFDDVINNDSVDQKPVVMNSKDLNAYYESTTNIAFVDILVPTSSKNMEPSKGVDVTIAPERSGIFQTTIPNNVLSTTENYSYLADYDNEDVNKTKYATDGNEIYGQTTKKNENEIFLSTSFANTADQESQTDITLSGFDDLETDNSLIAQNQTENSLAQRQIDVSTVKEKFQEGSTISTDSTDIVSAAEYNSSLTQITEATVTIFSLTNPELFNSKPESTTSYDHFIGLHENTTISQMEKVTTDFLLGGNTSDNFKKVVEVPIDKATYSIHNKTSNNMTALNDELSKSKLEFNSVPETQIPKSTHNENETQYQVKVGINLNTESPNIFDDMKNESKQGLLSNQDSAPLITKVKESLSNSINTNESAHVEKKVTIASSNIKLTQNKAERKLLYDVDTNSKNPGTTFLFSLNTYNSNESTKLTTIKSNANGFIVKTTTEKSYLSLKNPIILTTKTYEQPNYSSKIIDLVTIVSTPMININDDKQSSDSDSFTVISTSINQRHNIGDEKTDSTTEKERFEKTVPFKLNTVNSKDHTDLAAPQISNAHNIIARTTSEKSYFNSMEPIIATHPYFIPQKVSSIKRDLATTVSIPINVIGGTPPPFNSSSFTDEFSNITPTIGDKKADSTTKRDHFQNMDTTSENPKTKFPLMLKTAISKDSTNPNLEAFLKTMENDFTTTGFYLNLMEPTIATMQTYEPQNRSSTESDLFSTSSINMNRYQSDVESPLNKNTKYNINTESTIFENPVPTINQSLDYHTVNSNNGLSTGPAYFNENSYFKSNTQTLDPYNNLKFSTTNVGQAVAVTFEANSNVPYAEAPQNRDLQLYKLNNNLNTDIEINIKNRSLPFPYLKTDTTLLDVSGRSGGLKTIAEHQPAITAASVTDNIINSPIFTLFHDDNNVQSSTTDERKNNSSSLNGNKDGVTFHDTVIKQLGADVSSHLVNIVIENVSSPVNIQSDSILDSHSISTTEGILQASQMSDVINNLLNTAAFQSKDQQYSVTEKTQISKPVYDTSKVTSNSDYNFDLQYNDNFPLLEQHSSTTKTYSSVSGLTGFSNDSILSNKERDFNNLSNKANNPLELNSIVKSDTTQKVKVPLFETNTAATVTKSASNGERVTEVALATRNHEFDYFSHLGPFTANINFENAVTEATPIVTEKHTVIVLNLIETTPVYTSDVVREPDAKINAKKSEKNKVKFDEMSSASSLSFLSLITEPLSNSQKQVETASLGFTATTTSETTKPSNQEYVKTKTVTTNTISSLDNFVATPIINIDEQTTTMSTSSKAITDTTTAFKKVIETTPTHSIVESNLPTTTLAPSFNNSKELKNDTIKTKTFVCNTEGNFVDPSALNVYYMCLRNSVGAFLRYKYQCQKGYYLEIQSVKCIPIEFNCTSKGKFLDKYKINVYYVCVKNPFGLFIRLKYQCQNNYYLDINEVQCIIKKNHETQLPSPKAIDFKCPSSGRFADKTAENIYYICSKQNDTRIVRYKFKCQDGLLLDKERVKCVVPQQTKKLNSRNDSSTSTDDVIYNSAESLEEFSNEFVCTKEGKFTKPGDCRRYYECHKKNTGGFKRKRKRCDHHKLFDKTKKKCVTSNEYSCKNH